MNTVDKDNLIFFRDLTKLTKWLKFFLIGCLAINLISLFSGFLTYDVLTKVQAGFYASHELLAEAMDQNDIREGIIAIFQLITILITAFLFSRWVYYANSNARALGAKDMKFTPRWSILWYFIPFWNLWKPYQVMDEIWKCSENPGEWKTIKTSLILRWWWFLWILSNLIDQIATRMLFRAKEIPELINSTAAGIVSAFMSIPLDIIAILLISGIFSMQMAQAELQKK